MKTLLILRHAKSSWKHPGGADHERPLNKRGKRDAPGIGRIIQEQRLTPDLILCSTAKRAKMTAHAVAEACGYDHGLELTRDFYLAAAAEYVRVLREVLDSNETVMVVGHNPGVEDLLEALTGADEGLPTAALARVSLPIEHWRELALDGSAELVVLWRPRELE